MLVWLTGHLAQGQSIKVTSEYGTPDKVLNQVLDFQNVEIENFRFTGEELIGRAPTITIREFKKGKLLRSTVLLDGQGEKPWLAIKEAGYELRFFTEIDEVNKVLKTFIRNPSFGAGKKKFRIYNDRYGYAMKDFFGSEKELTYTAEEEIPLLAIITPHRQENGWASYCEVVQSDVKPEDLGKHFGIPHYFLITVKFL